MRLESDASQTQLNTHTHTRAAHVQTHTVISNECILELRFPV